MFMESVPTPQLLRVNGKPRCVVTIPSMCKRQVYNWKWLSIQKELPYPLISDPKRSLIGVLGAGDGNKTKRSHFVFEKGGKLLDRKMPVKPADRCVTCYRTVFFIRWCDIYQSPACIGVYHRPQAERIGHEHVRSTKPIPWIYLISFCFQKYVHYLHIAISSLSLNDADAGTGRFELFLGHQKAAPEWTVTSRISVQHRTSRLMAMPKRWHSHYLPTAGIGWKGDVLL